MDNLILYLTRYLYPIFYPVDAGILERFHGNWFVCRNSLKIDQMLDAPQADQ